MNKLRKKIITVFVLLLGSSMLWIAIKNIVRIEWLNNVIGIGGLLVGLMAAMYFKSLFPGIDKRYYNNPNNKEWE